MSAPQVLSSYTSLGSLLNSFQAFARVLRIRGFKGLFSGLSVKLAKRAVTYSVMWPLQEVMIKFLAGDEEVDLEEVTLPTDDE